MPQEIAHLLALEEATLSTDLQQGYALKSLTGRNHFFPSFFVHVT